MKNKISYTHKKSKRAKHIRLTVNCDGSVVVTSPFWVRQRIIDNFIAEKRSWLIKRINKFKNDNTKPVRVFSHDDYLQHKEKARQLIKERLEVLNKNYNFKFNRISIRNQKTRWGSCSKKGNLNFNYKILFLSEELQDYIIVHELCHLKELNHSKKFWAEVGKTLPNYLELRKYLRKTNLYCK
ncbi:MAG: SprT family zinc-dependent metalloprotease [bacterium]